MLAIWGCGGSGQRTPDFGFGLWFEIRESWFKYQLFIITGESNMVNKLMMLAYAFGVCLALAVYVNSDYIEPNYPDIDYAMLGEIIRDVGK